MSKRTLSLPVVVLGGAFAAAAQPSEQESGRDLAPIAIPIELRDKYPFLTATVDGTDVKLKFDLGSSSALVLQRSTLDRIKAAPTGESSKFQSLDGVYESPKFKISHLRIGSTAFADVVTTVDASRPGYEPDPLAQGLLGTGLLKSHELVIDYPQRAMTLVPRPKEAASGSCKGTVVAFDQKSAKWRGEPVTEAQTEIGPVILWWDTGAPLSALRKTLTRDARFQADTVTMNRLTLGSTDFGPWQFESWDMSLPGFDGFLGYDFFAKHVVCVDFPGNRIVIVR